MIFVNGCFWHLHGCKASRSPKSNKGYWLPKLERNRTRDAENLNALRAEGWRYLILWECDLAKNAWLRSRVVEFLDSE